MSLSSSHYPLERAIRALATACSRARKGRREKMGAARVMAGRKFGWQA